MDTGTVTGSTPSATYAGQALRDGTRYWWTVRTLDAQGHTSQWASAAQFGTALGSTWDALPVWASSPPGGKSSGWAFLRGSVRILHKPVLAATVYATGTSTAGPSARVPVVAERDRARRRPGPPPDPVTDTEYSAWDVTSALTPGNDTFGALAYAASTPRFQLELVVQYKDGTRQTWGTGQNWQAMDGGAAYPAAGSVSPGYYTAPVEDLDAGHYPFGFDTPATRQPPPRRAGGAPPSGRRSRA